MTSPRFVAWINAWLDGVPRVYLGRLAGRAPAFRSCGVAGFYLALIVVLGVGLARGRPLPILLLIAAGNGLSFFAYAHARKLITGREQLVLLEHVWVALAASAAVARLLGEPWLMVLDAVAAGLPFFLAGGRIGCLLAGCCHGQPSLLGVRYGAEHVDHGLPLELTEVRLFPVQLVEAAGLVGIGLTAVALALFGRPGAALGFFLAGYGTMRFGLEGLRGDLRAHLLGLSQSRWMALAEVGLAAWLADPGTSGRRPAVALAALAAAALIGLLLRQGIGWKARVLRASHLRALRAAASAGAGESLQATSTALGFTVVGSHGARLISLSLPEPREDLGLLSAVAARAFPELEPKTARLLGRVVVVELPMGLRARPPAAPPDLAMRLLARLASDRTAVARPAPAPVAGASARPVPIDHRPGDQRSVYFAAPTSDSPPA